VLPRKMEYFRVIYKDILGKFPLTGVNHTSSGVKDTGRVSIADRLVDSPVLVSWRGSSDWASYVDQYRNLHW